VRGSRTATLLLCSQVHSTTPAAPTPAAVQHNFTPLKMSRSVCAQ
jgi:hypothetical protein